MKLRTNSALAVSLAVLLTGAAQAQTTPSAPPPPSSSDSSSTSPSTSSQSPSPTQPKDTSRGAKEQQSQQADCPKNGDKSNVNCKATSNPPKD